MKNNTKISLLFFSVLMVGWFLMTGEALAANPAQYPFLEKIPGTATIAPNDLAAYISAVYKVALVVVTLSAVLMLSIGGFMYLTSAGNTSSISTAKGIIYDSLIGLVIALCAWLILYTINPDLIEITLKPFPSATIATTELPPPTPGGTGGTAALPPQSSIQLAQQIIANPNIRLEGTPSADCSSPSGKVSPQKNLQDVASGQAMAACQHGCKTMGGSGCTDNKITPSSTMLQAIWTVGQTMSFTITSISGGAHASGSEHYKGQAIDIQPVSQALLDAFVKNGAFQPAAPPIHAACQIARGIACGAGKGSSMCHADGGNLGCAPGSGAHHIHIEFPN